VIFTGVPVGAVCTLSEPEDGGADAVAFSPSPVVTVTADSPRTIDLVVTNTFSRTPVPTPNTSTPPVPADSPTGSSSVRPPSATPSGSSDDLARTGADDAGPMVGAAALLLALGAVAVLSRRRRASR
jgi:LPXTG-motif cell wall-anchored protein